MWSERNEHRVAAAMNQKLGGVMTKGGSSKQQAHTDKNKIETCKPWASVNIQLTKQKTNSSIVSCMNHGNSSRA